MAAFNKIDSSIRLYIQVIHYNFFAPKQKGQKPKHA